MQSTGFFGRAICGKLQRTRMPESLRMFLESRYPPTVNLKYRARNEPASRYAITGATSSGIPNLWMYLSDGNWTAFKLAACAI